MGGTGFRSVVRKGLSDTGCLSRNLNEMRWGPQDRAVEAKGTQCTGALRLTQAWLAHSSVPSASQDYSGQFNSLTSPICVNPKIRLGKGPKRAARNKELEGNVDRQGSKAITPKKESQAAAVSSSRPGLGSTGPGRCVGSCAGPSDSRYLCSPVGSGEVGRVGSENCVGLTLGGSTEWREMHFRTKQIFKLCVTLTCHITSGKVTTLSGPRLPYL